MKLSPLTVLIIGLSILIAAAGVSYSIYAPNMEDARNQNELANKLITEANKQAKANERVKRALADVDKMAVEWQKVVAVKTPPNNVGQGGINLAVNRWQLTNDSVQFRNNIQRAVNHQLKHGGVTVVGGPIIPAPPAAASQIVEYYNYPAIRFPVLAFDLGTITVKGTYAQIVENVRAWTNMPNYLAVADGLAITGTTSSIASDPQTMTGTYNLTLVAYIRGDKVGPPVPEGGGGSAPGGSPPGVPGGAPAAAK